MVKRVNISFPEKTLNDLKELVPPRERSKLVSEAVEEKLNDFKRAVAFEKLEKAREKFSSFETIKSKEDTVAWVKNMRKGWNRRETSK
ncbi:MAG: hypothetical protein A2172_01190 [Candidatus Woykebacteria bacterium RBG_13_40_15]|uniref:Ribbon-helix-helix protein CopG domain-containing protein n=1 Tax=Candidatus Woykebacteria bacterium RBG_13_40_15 TaxID=1802593 RepID=A0A1G1W8Z4_9BACT|nr:MAG: hypothetical protein A2172_01190 [Candidatus Woykebacteria bacterium RBG_13_40_15]